MIEKKITNRRIDILNKYYTIIDEEVFLDYLCFFYENEKICLTLDSSAENISIINFDKMSEDIKRTGIEYMIECIKKDIFLEEIFYEYDEYEQLKKIKYIFEGELLEISIGLDSLLYKLYPRSSKSPYFEP